MCIIIYEQQKRKLNYKKMYFNSVEGNKNTLCVYPKTQKYFF